MTSVQGARPSTAKLFLTSVLILCCVLPSSAIARSTRPINIENQVDAHVAVHYPASETWVTEEQLKIIGLDRFAAFTADLNADMNDVLNALHSMKLGNRLRRRLENARPRFMLFSNDNRTVNEVFAQLNRLGVCPGDAFRTNYSYVVVPTLVRGIERNPPDLLFPGKFRFALHGDGVPMPSLPKKQDDTRTFDIQLNYFSNGSIAEYSFTIKPCP